MPLFETILTRMLGEPAFAEAVFRNTFKALESYKLSNEEIARFRAMPRAEFEAAEHEYRKLLAAMQPRPPRNDGVETFHSNSVI